MIGAGGLGPRHSFFVHGVPQAQGSTRAFVVNGKPVITSTNKNINDWRRLIADAAQEHAELHEGPIAIRATFLMPRPKTLAKKIEYMIKRPDIDKLQRALYDALTGVFYKDDSQITECHIRKSYGISQVGVNVEIWASE